MIERDSIIYEGTTVEYEVYRSKRRKKYAHVSVDDGVVQVAVPWNTKSDVVRKVVRDNAQLILSRLDEMAQLEERVTRIE